MIITIKQVKENKTHSTFKTDAELKAFIRGIEQAHAARMYYYTRCWRNPRAPHAKLRAEFARWRSDLAAGIVGYLEIIKH